MTKRPEKSHLGQLMEKQRLKDLYHKIDVAIGSYLVLDKEGSKEQREPAREKAKSEFHRFGPDMQKMATQMKQHYPALVSEFLKRAEAVFLAGPTGVDPAKVSAYHQARESLEKELSM